MTVLVARLILVGVFAIAGIAKLTDREGVRRMTGEFGAPAQLAGPLAWGLIGAELGVAAALAIGATARVGALAGVVLLLAFGVAVAITVARGRRPECHCFGRLQSNEVGWSTVSRNALLAAVAGLIATGGRFPLAFAAIAGISIAAWMTLTLRRPGVLRRGAPAPGLALSDHTGRGWTLESLLVGGRPLLLVFGDPDCDACRELLPQVAAWQAQLESELTVAIVSAGRTEDNIGMADEFGVRALLGDKDRGAAADYGIRATPSAVVVDQRQRIAADPAVGAQQIAGLVARVTSPDRDPTIGRRAVLVRAAMGIATVTVAPFITAAAAAARSVARPKKLKVDGAWLCDQRYALCTWAACKPSTTNQNVSVCRCKVTTGYSVGFKNCEKRAPKGRRLHSNFSLQDVTERTRVLKCSERGLWVQCLDMVCEVDRHDPKHANCQCMNNRTKNFYTFGGDCKTETCESVIWSSTTAPFPGGAQYEKGLKHLGVPFKVPKSCPVSKQS